MVLPIVGVMGSGEHATATDITLAYELGTAIADAGWVLLTGGRAVGVMDAASRGAHQAGGLVIGILPTAERSHLSTGVSVAICTGLGNARNVINVLSSDVVVACGMGTGTASEVALALKADKPVILLNSGVTSQRFFQELGGTQVTIAHTVPEVMILIQRYML
jgi:hypothetical protein